MDREFGGSPYGWLMDRQYVKVYNYLTRYGRECQRKAAIGAHDAGCSRKDKGVVSVMVQGGGGISRKA